MVMTGPSFCGGWTSSSMPSSLSASTSLSTKRIFPDWGSTAGRGGPGAGGGAAAAAAAAQHSSSCRAAVGGRIGLVGAVGLRLEKPVR